MATTLLMPKATAVWLIDNTALTFDQVADFCSLHLLEVQGIADGDVSGGVRGVNPINNAQLSRDEIKKGEADSSYRLKISEPKVLIPTKRRKGPRYTPISRRNERPGAIKWLVRNHPELKDAAIIRLVGTTKTTIEAVREGTHWNSANLNMLDPVTLGLCTQIDLDMEVRKSSGISADDDLAKGGTMLLSAEEALAKSSHTLEEVLNLGQDASLGDTSLSDATFADVDKGEIDSKSTTDDEHLDAKHLDAESVFANLKSLKKDS